MSESLRKGRGIWNVRAIPRWQILCAGRPVMSSSRNRIEPAVGRSVPAVRLKVVLLPDPFGPMRPTISPSRTSNDPRLTARNPPKRRERSVGTSIVQRMAYIDEAGSGRTGSWVLMLAGQTTEICSPAFCITTGVERSFWPESCVPGGGKFSPQPPNGPPRGVSPPRTGLAHRLRVEAAILLLGDGQHVVEQDPGLIESHRAMRRHVRRVGLGLVALDHHLGEIAQARRERRGIEQLRGHRIDVAEIVDVLA